MYADIANHVLLTSDNNFVIALFKNKYHDDSIGVFSLEERKQIHKIRGTSIIV